jgi:predicted phage tail protein
MKKLIQGAGGGGKGGGGGGRVPVEQQDSLRSKAFAKIIDAVCEGEIEGLADGLRSIYLDGTRLQNSDGSFNFQGFEVVAKNGTQSQSYIPGFPNVENGVVVNVEVTQTTPVVRQITNTNINSARVTITVPGLTFQEPSTGDINGASAEIAIDLQSNGGGFNQVLTDTITGKTTSRYQRSYSIPLTGSAPWDIRVRRITADSTQANLQNKTFWDTYTEVIDAKLRYPNTALVGVKIDSSQFQSIPVRGYDMKLLRVRIPTNYNPTTRVYTGSWDGSFQVAWTDNPAWCFYDLVTNERYGLGGLIDEAQVDKWAMYQIGRYCDELVSNGRGGQEPRFTCNIYMQARAEAYKVVQDFASIFQGMAFWSTGSLTAIQDAPSDPVALFTTGNVVGGKFTYSGSSIKARHTVALVTWNDPQDLYRQKVEYVEDVEGIERYGVIQTEVSAIGCSSQGQAARVGRWLLYSERFETETVQFSVGLDGAVVRPGHVIKVADNARAATRIGGRIRSSTSNSITVDVAPTQNIVGWTLFVTMPDGSVEQSTVTGVSGDEIQISTTFVQAPGAESVWVVSGTQVEAQTFRVVGISEGEGGTQYVITALKHEPSKYGFVEQGLRLEDRQFTILEAVPSRPNNLTHEETLYFENGALKSKLTVSWNPVEGAGFYWLFYRHSNGNWTKLETSTPSVDILDTSIGVYEVQVYSVSPLGIRSASALEGQINVLGKTEPPSDVLGFTVVRAGENLNFIWRHIPDLDLDYYEIRNGDLWETSVPVGVTRGNSFSVYSPRGGNYLIKAVDTSGVESRNAALVAVSDLSGINVIFEYVESENGWNGIFTKTRYYQSLDGVTLASDLTWNDLTQPWQSYTSPWVFIGVTDTSGTYVTEIEDLGIVTNAIISIEPTISVLARSFTWNDLTQPWNYYSGPDWTWQGKSSAISATFEISTSLDGVTWTDFAPFVSGNYELRFLRYRITLETSEIEYLPLMTEFKSFADVPDREIHLEDVNIPTTGKQIDFDPPFVGLPTVQVTLQSASVGDNYTVTNKTNSSVMVNVFDASGNPKIGLVDIDAFGYGELIL